LNYAVGLTNYIDLVETLGNGGNIRVGPNGQTITDATDPYYMKTWLRMGIPPYPAN